MVEEKLFLRHAVFVFFFFVVSLKLQTSPEARKQMPQKCSIQPLPAACRIIIIIFFFLFFKWIFQFH